MPSRRSFLASLCSLAAAAGLSRFAGGAAQEVNANRGAWAPPPGSKCLDVPGYPGWRWWLTNLQLVPVAGDSNTCTVRASYVAARFDERGRIVEMLSELPEA